MENRKAKIIEKILRDRDVRREVTTKDFEWFFPVYFHKRFEYETPPFHEEIFRLLQDVRIPLIVLTAFRGSAKSTIVTVAYSLWAVFGIQQKKFVILVAQTETKARQYLMNIRRQLENNKLLRDDLGPIDEEKDQWGATALVIRKLDAKIMVASVGQSIRGSLHNEHRPDLVILDDVEDTESVKTREGRDKLFDWFTAEVLPVGGKRTRFVVVGNLLHEDSLMRRLQKRIEENPLLGAYREYPIMDMDGKALWPSKYPTPESIEAERMKMMDPIAWAREYLLKIVSPDDQTIKREWIQTYSGPAPTHSGGYAAVGIDLAISMKQTADCTAMVAARVYGHGDSLRVYILPKPVNKRLTSMQALDEAKALSKALGNAELWIEDVGYQGSLVEHLRHDNYKAKGVKVHGMDKRQRLAMVSFLVESGKVLFPEKGAEELIRNLTGFGTEKHDDLVDAFSILLSQILEEDHKPRVHYANLRSTDYSDLNHLSSRAKMVEIEKRQKGAAFFQI
jgi:predicted phage terminase large subunit-like protein